METRKKRRSNSFVTARNRRCFGVIAVAVIWLATPVASADALPPSVVPPGSYVYPVMTPRLSSHYGKRKHPVLKVTRHHKGVDLAAPTGAQIRAIQSGVVVFADPHGGYGKLIVIEHSKGLTSHYGHCQSIKVNIGERVRAGQIIGTVGSTGRVTGPHLHLEIRRNGKAQNPEKFIPDLALESSG